MADTDGQAGLSDQLTAAGLQPGAQAELEIIDDPEAFELAVDGLEFDPVGAPPRHQVHHRLNLQLEDLQLGHRVAVAPRSDLAELLGLQQGFNHLLFIVQVGTQTLSVLLHRQLQRLAGTEGQGHQKAAGAA